MKIILCILICALLANPVAYAAPQTVDLETMTLNELIQLRIAVNRAIKALESDESADVSPSPSPTPAKDTRIELSQGSYIVGKDIPSGRYSIRITNNAYLEFSTVFIYLDSSKDVLGLLYSYMVQPKRPIGRVDLQKDNVVEINGDNVVLLPVK